MFIIYSLYSYKPSPPFDVNITVKELNLVATWNQLLNFTLEGEELSYVVTIINTASGIQEEVTVNTTIYAFSESFGQRHCAEYRFTVFYENDYSYLFISKVMTIIQQSTGVAIIVKLIAKQHTF